MSEPITRSEMYLAALNGEAVTPPEPITRMDMYMAYLNGMTDTYPEPITRTEQYLYKLCQNGMGGGGGVTIRNQNKTITENGSYKADSGYTGLGTVTVNVPQEDPVLQDKTVTENGTVTADAGFDGLGVVTVNVEAGGGGGDITAFLDGTITEYSNNEVTTLKDGAFWKCKALNSVNLPNLVTVGAYGFGDCTALTSLHFPNLESVGSDCFSGCTSLTRFDIPTSLKTLAVRAFNNCTKLTEVNITDLTAYCKINFVGGKSSPMYYAKKLYLNGEVVTNVDVHDATTIGEGAFAYCADITDVIAHDVTHVNVEAFIGCTGLADAQFPAFKGKLLNGTFKDCTNLKKLAFGAYGVSNGANYVANNIPNTTAFQNCTSLETLILYNSDVWLLGNVSNFSNTPIAGGTGYIYVPASKIEEYKIATNWSTYASQFRAIEDYPDICGEVSA